jgi:hypothetical protein
MGGADPRLDPGRDPQHRFPDQGAGKAPGGAAERERFDV